MDIEDDGDEYADAEEGNSPPRHRPTIRSHPARIDSDDEDISAAVAQSLQTGQRLPSQLLLSHIPCTLLRSQSIHQQLLPQATA